MESCAGSGIEGRGGCSSSPVLAVAFLGANLCEGIFLWVLLVLPAALFLGVFLHVLGAFLLHAGLKWGGGGAAPMVDPGPGRPVRVPAATLCLPIALPLGLLVPFFGTPGVTLLCLILPEERPPQSAMVQDYLEYVKHRGGATVRYEPIDVEEATLERLNVEPVVDLLSDSDKPLVWGSIEMLSKIADEEAVNLIRKTMDDQDMDVKFFSSWGLDRIEGRFLQDLERRRRELGAKATREGLVGFLEAMNRYLRSGLLDKPMAGAYFRETSAWLKDLLRRMGDDPETVALLAVGNQLAGNQAESLEGFLKLKSQKKLHARFLPDCATACFEAGDLDSVKELIREFCSVKENQVFLEGRVGDPSILALRDFWLGGEKREG